MPSSRLCQDFTFSRTKLLVGPHFQEDNFFSMHFFTGPYFLAGPYFFAGLNVLQDHTFFSRTKCFVGPHFQQGQFFRTHILLDHTLLQDHKFFFAGPHFYRAKLYSKTAPFSKTKFLQDYRTTLLAGPISVHTFLQDHTLLQDHTSLAGPNFYRTKLYSRTTLFSRTKSLQVHRTTLLSGPIFCTHFFTGPNLLQDQFLVHTFLQDLTF